MLQKQLHVVRRIFVSKYTRVCVVAQFPLNVQHNLAANIQLD